MEQNEIRIIIGRNIRHRRQLAGLSQAAVGHHLGITFQQVQKYENGANGISCDKLIKLAALFCCTVNDLCAEAVGELPQVPEHPWNPYKVHNLLASFNRIRSHGVRNRVCGIVCTIADLASGKPEETL